MTTVGPRDRWYVTSPFATGRTGSVRAPARQQMVHAKELGSSRTVCGRPTDSWHKFYDRSFLAEDDLVRCAQCLRGVGAG